MHLDRNCSIRNTLYFHWKIKRQEAKERKMEVLTILLCVALVVVVLAMVLKYFPDMRYPTLEMVPMYYFRDLGLATAPDTPGAEARSKIQAWFDTRSLPRPQVAVATSRESKGLGQPDYMKDNTYYRFVLNGRWYELGGSWQRLSLHEAEPMITFVSTGAQLVGAVNTVGKWIWHLLNNKLVRGTCVSFLPMFDRPSGFNFCQEQDQMPVHLVCEELVKRNPKCKLSMYGGCKGASVLLATLAHYGKMHKDLKRLALSSTSNNLYQWIDHIVALVCESPVLSVAKYMRWQWGGKFVMDHMIEYCYSNNSHRMAFPFLFFFCFCPVLVYIGIDLPHWICSRL